MKTLRDRVEAGFGDRDSAQFAEKYLDLVIATWREISTQLRRTSLLIVVLAVATELLLSADVKEVTFGPLKVSDVSFLTVILPAVVAYLLHDCVTLIDASNRFDALRGEIARKLYRPLWENDLEFFITPGTLNVWGVHAWDSVRLSDTPVRQKIREAMSVLVALALLLGAVVYVVSVFVRLLDSGQGDALLWGSMAFAAFNLVRAGLALSESLTQFE
jgi:hypothetical protein